MARWTVNGFDMADVRNQKTMKRLIESFEEMLSRHDNVTAMMLVINPETREVTVTAGAMAAAPNTPPV